MKKLCFALVLVLGLSFVTEANAHPFVGRGFARGFVAGRVVDRVFNPFFNPFFTNHVFTPFFNPFFTPFVGTHVVNPFFGVNYGGPVTVNGSQVVGFDAFGRAIVVTP